MRKRGIQGKGRSGKHIQIKKKEIWKPDEKRKKRKKERPIKRGRLGKQIK